MTTAVYDGRCVICNSTRRVVSALDWRRRVEFLDLHEQAEVSRRYPWLDQVRAMGEIHVIDSADAVFSGYDGVRRLLRELPLGLPLWGLLHLPGMGVVGRRVYRWVARRRYGINRLLGVALDPCEDDVCKIS
jgi:predicted DCC family thiol-disulfide oxidoreductase YuxK